jgi:hypothetical protein
MLQRILAAVWMECLDNPGSFQAVLIGPDLHFLSAAEQRHQRNIENQIAVNVGRQRSDAYVNPRGTIWWNGARSIFINGQDIAMFCPSYPSHQMCIIEILVRAGKNTPPRSKATGRTAQTVINI